MNQNTSNIAPYLDALDQCFRDQLIGDYFEDPVTSKYGHSYERSSILDWLKHNKVCPYSKKPLSVSDLIPNIQLKESTIEYLRFREALNLHLNPASFQSNSTKSGSGNSILELRGDIIAATEVLNELNDKQETHYRLLRLAEDDYFDIMKHDDEVSDVKKENALAKVNRFKEELEEIKADKVSVNRRLFELENSLEEEEKRVRQILANKNQVIAEKPDETIKLITSNRIREKGKKVFETDKKKAYEYFTEAINAYAPFESARYYFDRAAAEFHLNKLDNCIADCNKSIEINNLYSKAYKLLGDAYYKKGHKIVALNEGYRKALECEPNNAAYKGIVESLQEEFAKAEKEKRKHKSLEEEEEEREHQDYQRRFGTPRMFNNGDNGFFNNLASRFGSWFPNSYDI